MVYINNKREFDCAFKLVKDGKEEEFVFGCKRVYSDTGNLAQTGVTAIEDETYNYLYNNCPAFAKQIKEGVFVKQKESGVLAVSNKIDTLEKENASLKAKLEESNIGKESEETKKLADENKSLKAQIEDLKKAKSKAKTKQTDVTEGF